MCDVRSLIDSSLLEENRAEGLSGERFLWIAVIERAVIDTKMSIDYGFDIGRMSGAKFHAWTRTLGFVNVCEYANLNPSWARRRLRRVIDEYTHTSDPIVLAKRKKIREGGKSVYRDMGHSVIMEKKD